jgi:hypothetical protein
MNPEKLQWPLRSYSRDIFAWLLICGGLISLIAALSATMSQPTTPWRYSYIFEIKEYGNSLSGSHSGRRTIEPLTLSLWMTISITVAAIGYVIRVRRFSLRVLLAFALLAGALGSLPAKYVQVRGGRADYTIVFPKPFTTAQIDTMRKMLEPRAALATLPPELLNELNLKGSPGIESLEIVSQEHAGLNGAKISLRSAPQLTVEQGTTLAEFFLFYFETLATEAAIENGPIKQHKVSPRLRGVWTPWIIPWQNLRAEQTAKQ